jgi:hypothetical protein
VILSHPCVHKDRQVRQERYTASKLVLLLLLKRFRLATRNRWMDRNYWWPKREISQPFTLSNSPKKLARTRQQERILRRRIALLNLFCPVSICLSQQYLDWERWGARLWKYMALEIMDLTYFTFYIMPTMICVY